MKAEFPIYAAANNGMIADIRASQGQPVVTGQLLVVMEE
jgi:biotin carboxyl carrier protein